MVIVRGQESLNKAQGSTIDLLILFPGTREDYEKFRGYEVEVIDTCRQDKGVYHSEVNTHKYGEIISAPNIELARNLANERVEALIGQRAPRGGGDRIYSDFYGLPVRRKLQ